jgi:hypothetical protein
MATNFVRAEKIKIPLSIRRRIKPIVDFALCEMVILLYGNWVIKRKSLSALSLYY